MLGADLKGMALLGSKCRLVCQYSGRSEIPDWMFFWPSRVFAGGILFFFFMRVFIPCGYG